MATAFTSLLGLALPVTGELAGTWGDTVNNSITSLLDSAVAGTTTLSTDADVTLTTTTGATNQSRQAILRCSGARTVLRTITAPAQSKMYVVINSTTGGFGVKIVGVGPTTGVTVAAGKTAVVVWNGSDFVEVAPAVATTATNLAGGLAGSMPYQTAASTTTMLGIGAANRILTSTGSAPQWSNTLSGLASIAVSGNITGTSLTVHPTLNGKIGSNDLTVQNASGAICAIGMSAAGSGFSTLATLNFVSNGSTVRGGISCAEDSGGNAGYVALSTRDSSNVYAERVRVSGSGAVTVQNLTASQAVFTDASKNLISNAITGTGSVVMSTSPTIATPTFTTSATFPLHIGGTATTSTLTLRSTSGVGTTGADIIFQVGNNGATEAMRVLNSGNLGLGTAAPTNLLSLGGNAARTIWMERHTTANTAGNNLTLQAGGATSGATDKTGGSLLLSSGTSTGTGTSVITFLTASAGSTGTVDNAPAERMRITSAGNVGIGTTTPGNLLTLRKDTAAFEQISTSESGGYKATFGLGYSATETFSIKVNATSGAVRTPFQYGVGLAGALTFDATNGVGTEYIALRTNAAERMRIDSAGNVGIGTTTPGYPFHVVNTQATITYGTCSNASTSGGSGWAAVSGVAGSGEVSTVLLARKDLGLGQLGTFSNHPVAFYVNTAERMRIDSAGNVGIGTATPGAFKLNVAGASVNIGATGTGNPGLQAISSDTAGIAYLALQNGTRNWSIRNEGTSGRLAFLDETTPAERMSITSAGNVGIGTTAPDARLHVLDTSAGGAVWGHFANSSGAANSTAVISLDPGNNGVNTRDAQIRGVNNGANQIVMSFWTANAAAPVERMRIDTVGGLLIGTTSTVGYSGSGTINAATSSIALNLRHTSTAAGKYWAIGPDVANALIVYNQAGTGVYINDGATAWTASSDERVKDIIEPIENAAEKVSSLRAVIGKYKKDAEGTRRSFLIAQDVQAVLPEAVDAQADEMGTLGVRYTDTIPLLVAAIKEQQATITALTTRIAALESK